MDVVQILKKLGFDEKDIRLYLILLSLGPSPVRKVAQATGINRGTAYDILKQLVKQGLVVYYHKEKNQSHCTILRNLGKKWIKILFAVWSKGTSYDETLHIQNLKAKNVPWAMAL